MIEIVFGENNGVDHVLAEALIKGEACEAARTVAYSTQLPINGLQSEATRLMRDWAGREIPS